MSHKIVNLDCANCATKIERYLDKNGIKAEINYINETIDIDDKNKKEAQSLIDKIEPGVKILDSGEEAHSHGELGNRKLILFALSIVLATVAYFTDLAFIYVIAYFTSGYSILYKTYLNLKSKQFFDENFLITVATLGALFIGEYIEAIIILLFFQIGEYFEDVAVNKSKKSIESLLDSRDNEVEIEGQGIVDVLKVKIGDIIVVKPNQVISVDGKVLNDNVELDESSINGESKTTIYNQGDSVLSGTINTSKAFRLEATSTFNTSYASKITALIKDAQKNKSNTEKFITKFARVYTPIVVLLAIVIMSIQLLLGNSVHDSIYTGIIFLVVSCPCALVISIPLGYFGGIGLSSKNNILVKGSQYLEESLRITDIAFDKTGTLTDGKFKIISNVTNIAQDEFNNLVGSAELLSSHVIARQIVKELDFEQLELDDVTEVTSKGLSFNYKGDDYLIGNASFTNVTPITSNYTIIYVSKNNEYIGHIELGDELRDGVTDLFERLHENGVKTHILSGDNSAIIDSLSTTLKSDYAAGNLLAEDKFNYLKKLKDDGSEIMFIGDGVNDAASIVEADIGVAVGSNATTLAVETSDVVFINNSPTDVLKLKKIANHTQRIVYQNIFLAFFVKGLFLVLATFGVAGIYEAIFADVGVALVAIFNAYRLIKFRI